MTTERAETGYYISAVSIDVDSNASVHLLTAVVITKLTISFSFPDRLRPAAASLVAAEVKATKPVEEATLEPAPWWK